MSNFNPSHLQELIERICSPLAGSVSVQVSGLSRPFVAGWHANDVIPAASIVKLPILLELCWQLAEERVDEVARFRLERPRSMADALASLRVR